VGAAGALCGFLWWVGGATAVVVQRLLPFPWQHILLAARAGVWDMEGAPGHGWEVWSRGRLAGACMSNHPAHCSRNQAHQVRLQLSTWHALSCFHNGHVVRVKPRCWLLSPVSVCAKVDACVDVCWCAAHHQVAQRRRQEAQLPKCVLTHNSAG
jgi:hypothetical protein